MAGIAQAAAEPADRDVCKVDDSLGQAAAGHDFTGEHKERNGHQRGVVGTHDHVLRDDRQIRQAQIPHQRNGTQNEDERDGNTERNRHGQRHQKDSNSTHYTFASSSFFKPFSA